VAVHIYTQTIHRTTQITTEQHKYKLTWKSVGRAPSLWVLPWHLPCNWGKGTEKPQLSWEVPSKPFYLSAQTTPVVGICSFLVIFRTSNDW